MCDCGNQRSDDIYLPQAATLVEARKVTGNEKFFRIKLDSGEALGHKPGQFVEVSLPGIGEAPISISSAANGNGSFDLVVREVGNVTRALHGLEDGAKVGIRGPFGTQFPVDGAMKGKDVVFVCGGIGLVPVRSAIQHVMANRSDYGKVSILFGTRSPSERLFVEEAQQWAATEGVTFIETVDKGDDSWTGNVGVITTIMPMVEVDAVNTVAVICGPPIMYKFVIIELRKMGIADEDVYVSLERNMKCGVGKCGHCQINHLYVCQDGPVFKLSDVSDIREAI